MNNQEPKTFRDAAIEFLKKPENLRVALEIEPLLPQLKGSLMLNFWKLLEERIILKLSLEPNSYWKVKISNAKNLENLLNNEGVVITPSGKTTAFFLEFVIYLEMPRFYWGICWNDFLQKSAIPNLPTAFLDCFKQFEEKQKQEKEWKLDKENRRWPIYQYDNYNVNDPEFLASLTNEEDLNRIANDISDKLIFTFRENCAIIEQANQELLNSQVTK